ncbi:MAG: DUF4019 domain-containing protein [Chlamydiales bacterium]|nr:DUF4019 domain-containing protein [Chlamydiales bacterium]
MKTAYILLVLLASPLLGDTSAAFPPNPYETEGGRRAPTFSAANAQAIYWITLIDQHQYAASWLEAAGIVQDIITQDQWAAGMRASREGFGGVRSRKVTSHQTATNLPGGLRGNFMIIKYQTNFSRKPFQVETITLMTEGRLGLWKVISYRVGSR